jgi:signal transduction histidine kinase
MSAMTAVTEQLAAPVSRSSRWIGLVPRIVAAVVVLLRAADAALHLHTGDSDLTSWWFGDLALAATLLVPGVLITLKRPGNAIGWLLLVASATTALAGAGREYLAYGFLGGTAPGYLWIGWFTDSLYIISMQCLPLVVMLFPDGRVMSRRTRPLLAVPMVGMVCGTFGALFFSDATGVDVQGRRLYNPARHALPAGLGDGASNLGMLLFFASVILAIGTLVLRYRRADAEVRLQMKWVVWAGGIGIVELVTEMIPNNQVSPITGPIASTLLTASVCIAVLRHRLFDIDVVINRTLVFAALTALVVGLYVATVALFGVLLDEHVHIGAGLLATALVAVVFAPARSRLQAGVDRLVYGERKNPYGVMTQLGRRLQSGETPGELDVVVDTVTQALKLPYAALFGADGTLLAESGSASRAGHSEALLYQGSSVGRLVIEPRDASPFSRDERRLIADLGRQIAAAVHAVRLSADLQASRLRLVTAKEEERRRLRRDLHDGLGPKLAAQALKLDAARTMIDTKPERAKHVLGEVKGDIRTTIEDIRHLVYGLRPPALDELGLVAAVRECARRFESPDGPVITLDVRGEVPTLPAAAEVAVYWIVNEAVTNVTRHASARHCVVTLGIGERSMLLSVVDDGVGLGEWRAGVGTSSMAERAAELGGTLRLQSRHRGTELHVVIPLAVQHV